MNETTQKPDNLEDSDSMLSAGRPGDGAGTNPGQGPESGEGDPIYGDTMSASQEIALLKKERDELRDQALRVRAEFANYPEALQAASRLRPGLRGRLAGSRPLDPLDNFERANDALRASGDGGITAGLDMVRKQLLEILAKHGVEPIAALGHAVRSQPARRDPTTTLPRLSRGNHRRRAR